MPDPGEDWLGRFPPLAMLPADIRAELGRAGRVVRLPAGARIFGPGQAPDSYLLLIEGTIRVQQIAENGREIVLYRVVDGESCALTTACLLGKDDYPAEAIAETDLSAVAIASGVFDGLIARSPEFRRFVFAAFGARVTGLLRLLDEIAFQRLDVRLADRLLALAGRGDVVTATHQDLAAELGTAREVVSRLLQEFHRRGWIVPGRGSLTIRNRSGLAALVATG